jgi:hypothetical protein
LSRVRDLFFDEFYEELERVVGDLGTYEEEAEVTPLLAPDVQGIWRQYAHDPKDRSEALISVDGGVQIRNFAYGDFITVGRACALVHWPGRDRMLEKRVKLYVGEVYDDRDRGFIPGYVRMICEYDAARRAAERVLEEDGKPIVLLDGSLYFARFPYAIREYSHHAELLSELFSSMSALRRLAKDREFPLVAVAKDSSAFYLYMELLRGVVMRAGLGRFQELLKSASSPMDLRMKLKALPVGDRQQIEPFIERRPLCDAALVASIRSEGYTKPLYLAPTIFYARNELPSLYNRINKVVEGEMATAVKGALESFFTSPGVLTTYWKPTPKAAPFRVDIIASSLGHSEPWRQRERNFLLEEEKDMAPLEKVLNHLGYWFCNDVEYNLPLKQADTLAHFDRDLYIRKYEPFIIRRLEEAGRDVRGMRRMMREG